MVPSPVLTALLQIIIMKYVHCTTMCSAQTLHKHQFRRFEIPIYRDVDTPKFTPKVKVAGTQHI